MIKKLFIDDETYLKTIELTDAKELFRLTSDQKVNKYVSYPLHKNIDETKKVIKDIFAADSGHYPHLGIFFKNNLIGEIGISNRRVKNELGYQLLSEYWGKGIITNVAKALIQEFFKKYPEEKIYVHADDSNIASWKVIEKLGFSESNVTWTEDESKHNVWWVLEKQNMT